jgi:hypothetical protein
MHFQSSLAAGEYGSVDATNVRTAGCVHAFDCGGHTPKTKNLSVSATAARPLLSLEYSCGGSSALAWLGMNQA